MTEPLPPPPWRPPDAVPPPPSPIVAPAGFTTAPVTSPTEGLRKATGVLFWCAVGAMALTALAAVNRRRVWAGFEDGSQTFVDVDDADALIGLAGLLEIGLTLASAIVLSIWSLRSMRNAIARREGDPNPGLTCGGWYIPFGWFVVPFVQFRKVLTARRAPASAVNRWQGLFVALGVCWVVFRTAGDIERADSLEDVADRLNVQVVVAVIITVLLALTTVQAIRAMRQLDGAGIP